MISRFTRSFFFAFFVLLLLGSLTILHPPTRVYLDPWTGHQYGHGGVEKGVSIGQPSDSVHSGGVIMGKLGNATAKAELGRATWKLLHTMTLRFPENPTEDERDALRSYIHLTSRLYPCGECAVEFQALLKQFPPQTSSRKAASFWLCHVHNQVNIRLKKPEFNCTMLEGTYDCGCGDADPSGPVDQERDSISGVQLIKGGV